MWPDETGAKADFVPFSQQGLQKQLRERVDPVYWIALAKSFCMFTSGKGEQPAPLVQGWFSEFTSDLMTRP